MLKSVLAFVGAAALLLAAAVYHYGFLSKKVDEVSTQIERETAVARAEGRIRDIEKRADDIGEKARKLRIDARARELAEERDVESRIKTQAAMKNLADAAKQAGLPKPSVMGPDDLKKPVAFAGRNLSGQDVLKLLQTWQGQLARKEQQATTQKKMLDSMRAAADQLDLQREKMLALVTEVRGKLEDLAMQRDMAKVEAELAELKATSSGSFSGELGSTLKTIQKEIDEKLATVEVLQAETSAQELSNPEAALQAAEAAGTSLQGLDKLFE